MTGAGNAALGKKSVEDEQKVQIEAGQSNCRFRRALTGPIRMHAIHVAHDDLPFAHPASLLDLPCIDAPNNALGVLWIIVHEGGGKQMRKVLMVGIGAFVTACAAQPDVPPVVTWSYGAGNGDPVQYQGPKPNYSFAPGFGADVPVSSGAKPTFQYGYGAENEKGMMVQMQPSAPPQQRVAAPATNPAQAAAPGSHS